MDWCLGGKGRIGGNVIPQSLRSFGIVTVEGLLVWWEGSHIREWTQGGRGGFRAKYALEDKVFMIPVPDLMTLVLEKNNTSCLFIKKSETDASLVCSSCCNHPGPLASSEGLLSDLYVKTPVENTEVCWLCVSPFNDNTILNLRPFNYLLE